jgi:hypothetical protein
MLNFELPPIGSSSFLLINANDCFGIFLATFFSNWENIVSKLDTHLEQHEPIVKGHVG